MSLDAKRRQIQLIPFKRKEYTLALETYSQLERETVHIPSYQVVLVSAPALKKLPYLRRAYPNYWLDVTPFVR
jgi:hypothetical protein